MWISVKCSFIFLIQLIFTDYFFGNGHFVFLYIPLLPFIIGTVVQGLRHSLPKESRPPHSYVPLYAWRCDRLRRRPRPWDVLHPAGHLWGIGGRRGCKQLRSQIFSRQNNWTLFMSNFCGSKSSKIFLEMMQNWLNSWKNIYIYGAANFDHYLSWIFILLVEYNFGQEN